MPVRSTKVIPLGLLGLAVGFASCSKGSKKSDPNAGATNPDQQNQDIQDGKTPGVTEASGDNLAVTGALALDLSLADAKPNKIVSWLFDDNGAKQGAEFDVDADGKFKVDVPRKGQLDLILSAQKADGSFDRDVLAKLFPDHAADIASGKITDDDIKGEVAKLKDAAETRGGHMVVLTSIDETLSTKLEQAESMHFIGLPTKSGQNMFAWPVKGAKGNFGLGQIKSSGSDEATSSLTADASTFDLDDGVLDALASTSRLLKALKNVWINGDKYRAEPFYNWQSSESPSVLKAGYNDPTKYGDLSDAGFYLAIRGSDKFTWDDLCKNGKKLEAYPPVAMSVTDNVNGQSQTSSFGPTTPFDNVGVTVSTSYGKSACFGGHGGFYGRKDSDDGKDIEVNWHLTPDKAVGIAAGWWHLKYEGEEVSSFDLGTGSPVVDGKPVVFVLKAKIETDDAGHMTKVDMIPTLWDAASSSYKELTELRPFLQLTSEVSWEISYGSNQQLRGMFKCPKDTGNLCTSEETVSSGDEQTTTALSKAGVTVDQINGFDLSYKIGDTTFRYSIRSSNYSGSSSGTDSGTGTDTGSGTGTGTGI